jgi:hypothetical protein
MSHAGTVAAEFIAAHSDFTKHLDLHTTALLQAVQVPAADVEDIINGAPCDY